MTTRFTDDFSSGSWATKWTTVLTGTANILDVVAGEGHMQVPNGSTRTVMAYDKAAASANQEILVKIRDDNSTRNNQYQIGVAMVGITTTAASCSSGAYIQVDGSTGNVYLQHRIGSTFTGSSALLATIPNTAVTRWWRVRHDSGVVSVKHWIDGASEPGTWTWTVNTSANGTLPAGVTSLSVDTTSGSTALENYYFDGVSSDAIVAAVNVAYDAATATSTTQAQDVTVQADRSMDLTQTTATSTLQAQDPTLSVSVNTAVVLAETPGVSALANDVSVYANHGAVESATRDYWIDGGTAHDDLANIAGLTYKTVMDFPLPSDLTNSGLVSAKLRVYVNSMQGASTLINVKPITAAWTTGDVSFSTGAGTTFNAALGWNEITVTGLVDKNAFYGFLLDNDDVNSSITMDSMAYNNPEQLVLAYDIVAEAAAIDVITPTVALAAQDVSNATNVSTNLSTVTISSSAQDTVVSVSTNPSVTIDVPTVTASLTASATAGPSIDTEVSLSTENLTLDSHDVTVEFTQSADIELDSPLITVVHIGLTDVNGEPIIPQEDEDDYFVSTLRSVQDGDIWYRLNEKSGTTVVDRANMGGTVQNGTYTGVTIGMHEGIDARHSVYFDGNASITAYDPHNPFTNTDEVFKAPSNLEFSIRTDRQTEFIMGGADQSATGIYNGPAEFWLQDGKINFRAYAANAPLGRLVTNIVGFTNIADNKWHHIAINSGLSNSAKGSRYLEIYIDGKLEIRRFAGVLGTSVNETIETQSILFGMPDMIGARGTDYGNAPSEVPALAYSNWFKGDMTEVVYRNGHTLSEDEILLQRDNMFGVKPFYASTPRITLKGVDASAKGNKTRVLVLDFQTAAYMSINQTNDVYAGKDAFGQVIAAPPYVADFDFPALRSALGNTYGVEGYQFFSMGVRNNFTDAVTDNERILDLGLDVNMDDYDVIAIGGFPQNDTQWAWYTGMDEYSTAPYVPGRIQVEHLINQIKTQVIGGKRLFVNDPASATMLGIIDRYEYVPNLRERAFNDNRTGAETGFYDEQAKKLDIWQGNSSNADRYRDQHANTRQRVRSLVDGLTSVPSYIATDFIEWINVDGLATPPYQEAKKYANRPTGLSLGDEFYLSGSYGPSLFDWYDSADGTPTPGGRVNGWLAAPLANVKVGKAVTSFASNVWTLDRTETNPFKDYAVSIVVEPGDSWSGQTVAGKVYVNFTEAFTQWASYSEYMPIFDIKPNAELPIEQRLTDAEREWQMSTYLGTWTGNAIQGNTGSGGAAITVSPRGEVQTASGKPAMNTEKKSIGNQLITFSWSSPYTIINVPVVSMAHRGLEWLASDIDRDGNATVGLETAEVTIKTNEAIAEASTSADVVVTTARLDVESFSDADTVDSDGVVRVTTPEVTVKASAFREVVDLDTAKMNVQTIEPYSDLLNNVDVITLTLPVHAITIYMEDN